MHSGLVVNAFVDTKAVIEFDTTPLPSDAVIDDLTYNFTVTAFANTTSLVNVMGYGRAGVITAADATANATELSSYSAVSLGLGNHSIDLDTSVLQSLLGTSNNLGLRLESGSSDTNTSIGSLEQGALLTLDVVYYIVPEPTSLGLLVPGAVALWIRRWGQRRVMPR